MQYSHSIGWDGRNVHWQWGIRHPAPHDIVNAIPLSNSTKDPPKLSRSRRQAAVTQPAQSTRPIRLPPPTIGAFVQKIAKPIYRQHGFTDYRILTHWHDIVGRQWAGHCLPERLSYPRGRSAGATLTVRVDGPLAVELQHAIPQILDRVNGFVGRHAITELKIVQGPLPRRDPRPKRRSDQKGSDGTSRNDPIDQEISTLQHDGLRHAMTAFARNLQQRRKPDS